MASAALVSSITGTCMRCSSSSKTIVDSFGISEGRTASAAGDRGATVSRVEVGLQKKIRHIIFLYTINCTISNLVCDKSCQHLINSLVGESGVGWDRGWVGQRGLM